MTDQTSPATGTEPAATDDVLHCTICSATITGPPLLTLTVEWRGQAEFTYEMCSPDCIRYLTHDEWPVYAGALNAKETR